MFHQLNQQYRKGRYIAPLLLLVFALCWGQNFGWVESCSKYQHSAAEQLAGSSSDFAVKHESGKPDCDKATHLLQQFQSDLNYAALSFFILLTLVLKGVVSLPLAPPLFFFSSKRRPHAVFCCFLE